MTEKHIHDITAESIARKQYFIKVAAQSLVRYGGIGTILADYMRRLLAAIQLDAEFSYNPGVLTVFMKDEISPAHGAQTLSIKTGLGYNFDKLEDTELVLTSLMDGSLYGGLDEAMSQLEKINRRPNMYGAWVHPLCWSIIAGLATLMLQGSYIDAAISLGSGLLFGLFLVAVDYYPPLGFTFDFWVSYTIAVLLAFVQTFYKNFTFWPPFLASVILILPGFSMAMGFMDVFSRQTVVGLTTIFNAAWTALSIGVGAVLGVSTVSTIMRQPIEPMWPSTRSPQCSGINLELYAYLPVYIVFNFFLNMSFQAKLTQAFLIIPLATSAFAVQFMLESVGMSPEASILIGCFFMGLVGQLYSKISRRSEMPSIYSGVIIFAPGTYGARATFYSMKALIFAAQNLDSKAALYALKQSGSMLTIAGSMAIGLLLSRALFGRL